MSRLCVWAGAVPAALGLLALAGCSNEAPPPEPESTEIPEELSAGGAAVVPVEDGLGTPMEDRVATLGMLNKRNNLTQDVSLKPGESRRVDNVVIRLSACERTAPWESPPEAGAFVQISVQERADADSEPAWRRVFSGWLFKNSPSLNVVEHPIYDIWVKDCAMSFPGEERAAARESATPAPAATTAPAPTTAEPADAPAEAPAAASPSTSE